MASDQMDVDVPASSSLEILSASSSLEKMDLENVDLEALAIKMRHHAHLQFWKLRVNTAVSISDWQPLILVILIYLTRELSETDLKESIITSPSLGSAETLVSCFKDTELEEWKAGIKKGMNDDDWSDLITHRMYISDYQMIGFHSITNPSDAPKAKAVECSLGCPN